MERAELIAWLRATGCAVERGGFFFLCDPHWIAAERAEAERALAVADAGGVDASSGWLCVRTGGSGGGVKFARHDERTLGAAVRGFCGHFGLGRVNAVDVLPPHHVSGLMARVRCAATGGEHVAWEWKKLEAGEVPSVPFADGDWVLSLVPTQLQRLLAMQTTRAIPLAMLDWLRSFRMIFLGGGPLWPELADAAAGARLRVSPSYGMTETAAMITASLPEEFLAGTRSSGRPMPHARVSVNADGLIMVGGESVFRGYFPEARATREFVTEDLGRIDERGHLHVLGRRDAVIITGGKKVQPAEVEAALRASGEFDDVVVLGLPDPEWGEAVVACYARGPRTPQVERATAALAPWQRPKRFVAIAAADWPRNAQGKVNRQALRAAIGDKR